MGLPPFSNFQWYVVKAPRTRTASWAKIPIQANNHNGHLGAIAWLTLRIIFGAEDSSSVMRFCSISVFFPSLTSSSVLGAWSHLVKTVRRQLHSHDRSRKLLTLKGENVFDLAKYNNKLPRFSRINFSEYQLLCVQGLTQPPHHSCR